MVMVMMMMMMMMRSTGANEGVHIFGNNWSVSIFVYVLAI